MSFLDAFRRFARPYQTKWRLFHEAAAMECRIVRVPEGIEVQFLYRGELYYAFVRPTRAEAEEAVRRKRLELIQIGWTVSPIAYERCDRGDHT